MTTDQRAYWDSEAATFDDEPDHGLRDPATRAAWDALMKGLLDADDRSLRVADLGCGTGLAGPAAGRARAPACTASTCRR